MSRFLHFLSLLVHPWTWRMAWRDSRRSRGRLLAYASSIVMGIAALTAISSFGHQMERAIDEQSKALLGADLVVTSRDPLTPRHEEFISSLGGERADEIAFGTMALFPASGGTRLVQVRAVEGGYPFYGSFRTDPPEALAAFRAGRGALVERGLMNLFDAKAGDQVRIGDREIEIAGALDAVPGETVAMGSIAPRIFVPLSAVEGSDLLGQGSLVNYKIHLRLEGDVEELADSRRDEFRALNLRYDTVEERRRDLGRGIGQMTRFLNLGGFVALLLGGVGVAAGIHAHMKQKLPAVATLRCLGASAPQAFAVYFAQAIAMGGFGTLAGALLGVAAQFGLQAGVADFLPVELPTAISLAAIWNGLWLGFLICLWFALMPLLQLRRVPPLAALQPEAVRAARPQRDPLVWASYLVAVAGLTAFGILQSGDWRTGLGYSGGLALAFGLLAGFAWCLSRLARSLVPSSWPFVWRHGVHNLHRPGNRTSLVTLSLGIGVFLILTMHLVQTSLVRDIVPIRAGDEGNTVLFDIQPDQRDGVIALLEEEGLPVLQDAPMISMRLHSIKGRETAEIRREMSRGGRWLSREYRSTYRSEISPTERLISGTWHERVETLDEPVPISMERELAGRLELGLGDELVFDVQGILVPCVVASLREVDWRRLSPNFFVVFPAGAIEAAPAIHAMVTQIDTSAQSARLQREVVESYPNVSAVDLTLILDTLDGIVSKVAGVVRFMAMFTIITGLLVLAGTIASGRQQRLRESILLRTLGASRGQVTRILACEYVVLGALAALSGAFLAHGAAWGMARWIFETSHHPEPWSAMLAVAGVSTVTLAAGFLGHRSSLDRPPLEVLRAEE